MRLGVGGVKLMRRRVLRDPMDDRVRRRLIIRGTVQGVWFRQSAKDEADRIGGLAGWVRNRHDGSVEAVVQGAPAAVDRLLEWCRRGPPGAAVTTVDVADEAPVAGERAFEVRG